MEEFKMNLLMESILMEYDSSNLDYLEEYLIVSGGITLEEGRELFKEVITEAEKTIETVKVEVAKKEGALKAAYNKSIKALRTAGNWTAEKAKSLKDGFLKKLAALRKWAASVIAGIEIKARHAKDAIKSAVIKKGVPAVRGKAGKMVKAPLLKRLTTTGKVGAAVGAAGLAAGAGYGGYKAYKALKKK
jgi:hypothetical protein